MSENTNEILQYKPIKFIVGVFAVTWACALLMTKIDYKTYGFLFTVIDFIESASPLIFALILLRRYLLQKSFLFHYILGVQRPLISYVIVFILFVAQYLNFYLFRTEETGVTMQVFSVAFIGQLLLGGGLEEAGWRGYLFPALRRKFPQDFLEFPKQLIDALQEFPGRRSKACDVCPLLAGLYRRREVPAGRTFRERQSCL